MAKPIIRFKGFEGEWEEVKLSNLSSYISSGKDTPSKGYFPLYGSTGIIGTVNNPSHDGPLLLVARVGANAGHIQLTNEKCGITDNTLIVCPKDNISLDYLYFFFHHSNLNKLVYGSGQPLITGGMLKNIDVCMGNEKESMALIVYFQHLDSLIQSTTKKIASLKQMKSACLISMFPQEGETKPRVRFKGFEGEWIKGALGELFTERIESNINGEMLSVTLNNGIIKAAENGRYDNSNSDKSHYKVVKVNDIAYNSMRMWQGASGCSTYEGIVSPAYTVVTPEEGVDSYFFACLFKTQAMIKIFRLHSQGLTSDTWNLKFPAFCKISVLYPKDVEEQKRIASFFRTLDSQITLQTQRLEKLKQIKSACLDKMFV